MTGAGEGSTGPGSPGGATVETGESGGGVATGGEDPSPEQAARDRSRARAIVGVLIMLILTLRAPLRFPPQGLSAGERILARDRARRGASGALYPQSASAGLNPRPRPGRSGAAPGEVL